MAAGEISRVRPRGTGLPVPYRRRDLAATLPPRGRALAVLAQIEVLRDRAPLDAALGAYAEGECRDALRVPVGFFRSRTV
jgi:hypothetical protein